ncbi:hypothetical protein CMI37_15665 [Candidatus Pacearchaeota archaeon]|jgi:hypothetical protein|nr:hypothetical protein [Candidatus Pacearchaeota archaeon]
MKDEITIDGEVYIKKQVKDTITITLESPAWCTTCGVALSSFGAGNGRVFELNGGHKCVMHTCSSCTNRVTNRRLPK